MTGIMKGPWFNRYAKVVVAVTVLLIWWGAAVTTENVGMAVPDWPLSYGSINPEGWWKVWPLVLEHGHRLVASLVGLLTLVMCVWAWAGGQSRLVRMLSAVALVAVIVQGVLGGVRVLHISNTFAVFHGCLAQAFFCLLILIVMASSRNWETRRRLLVRERPLAAARGWSVVFLGAVFMQLILGAVIRHTHRLGIADDGILTTGGKWFPGFGDFDLGILFSHKAWAVVVFWISIALSLFVARSLRENRGLRWHAYGMSVLLAAQLGLGMLIIVTAKTFWVTNFHVLTGLTILALAFTFSVRLFVAAPRTILLAGGASNADSGPALPSEGENGGTAAT